MIELDPISTFKSCASVVCLWQPFNQQLSILGHETTKLKHKFVQLLPLKYILCNKNHASYDFVKIFTFENGMKTQILVRFAYEFVNIDQYNSRCQINQCMLFGIWEIRQFYCGSTGVYRWWQQNCLLWL